MKKTAFLKTSFWLSICICSILQVCLAKASWAGSHQDTQSTRLLHAGIDLFPSFLAADRHISEKRDKDGFLVIYIVHHNDQRIAQKIATHLRDIKKIKNIPLKILIVRDAYDEFHKLAEHPAGIFIAQPHLPHIAAVVNYGKQESVITFSPFPTDISLGVAGSIAITARILPQVNTKTLADSKLELKPFFLRIAWRYPESELN